MSDSETQHFVGFPSVNPTYENWWTARRGRNIPPLLHRVTYPIIKHNEFPKVEIPDKFTDLNRHEENVWTGWFQGDGEYLWG